MKVIQSNFNGGRVGRSSVVGRSSFRLDSELPAQEPSNFSPRYSFLALVFMFRPRWCRGQGHATFFGRKQTMKSCAAILALACAFGATANAAELEVNQYEGPTECDDADKVKKGDYLSMHYTGTIDESSPAGVKGEKFDSSRDRGQTFDFTIGVGQVIKGWDEGLQGLCKGAKAKLIIPSEFGYGEVGAGGKIPGGATLNFDVEVVDITDPPARPPTPNVFKMIDTDEDNKLSVAEIEAYFKGMDKEMPEGLMESEDKDGDGFVSWEEFSGPKGDSPGGDEL